MKTLLDQWWEAKEIASSWAKKERDLREEVVRQFFGLTDSEGQVTKTIDIDGRSCKLVCTKVINRTFEKDFDTATAEALGLIAPTKPRVNVRAFKALKGNERQAAEGMIVERPGLPTLKVTI